MGIGFVSRNWVVGRVAVRQIGFVSHNRGAGMPGRRQRYGEIGFVSLNLVWRDTWYTEIGFVSCFWVVGVSPTSVGVKYRGGRPAACVSFRVRFAFFGCWGGRLGSFRIMGPDGSGEILNPNIEMLNNREIRNMKPGA